MRGTRARPNDDQCWVEMVQFVRDDATDNMEDNLEYRYRMPEALPIETMAAVDNIASDSEVFPP